MRLARSARLEGQNLLVLLVLGDPPSALPVRLCRHAQLLLQVALLLVLVQLAQLTLVLLLQDHLHALDWGGGGGWGQI